MDNLNLSTMDYSQYPNWKKVVLPSGSTLYLIPGTGYAYDPALSQTKGRPVLWNNPTNALEAQETAKKQADAAASPLGQIAPIAGSVAGTVGAQYLINALGPATAAEKLAEAQAAALAQHTAANAAITGGSGIGGGGAGGAAASASPVLGDSIVGAQTAGESAQSALAASEGAANSGAAAESTGLLGNLWGGSGAAAPAGQGLTGGAFGSALGLAGLAAGAYTGYQSLKGLQNIKNGDDMSFQQQAALALPTFGASFLYNPVKKMFDKDMWKTEGNKLQKLADSGVFVPDSLLNSGITHGRSKEELVKEAQEKGGNVQFAQTRDEKVLKPEDIVGYATFAEKDPEWFKKPLEQRLSLAQQALTAGAVREHHGTIDVDWSKIEQPQAAASPGAPVVIPKPLDMTRTSTSSPGIGLDGKPLTPAQMGQKLAERINQKNQKRV